MNKSNSFEQFRNKKAGIAILVAVHLISGLGILSPLREWFIYMIPVNVLIIACLIWIDTVPGKYSGFPVSMVVGSLGYAIEVIAVKTQALFGAYQYSQVLGWNIFEVPPLIGVYWLLLVWGGFSFAKSVGINRWFRWLATAILVVGVNLIAQPVGDILGFWTWDSPFFGINHIAGRFVVAAVLGLLFENYPLVAKPRMGLTTIICQVVYFGILYLSLF